MINEPLPEADGCAGCAARDRRIAVLEAQVAALEARLADLERQVVTGSRPAAPFSKGPPKRHPQAPGRKPGAAYGRHGQRALPPRIDEVHEVSLPATCPACGGQVAATGVGRQYQVELPRQVIYRQFNVAVGVCRNCHRRVQGRHALQTSDALGCCASQLGPRAQATAVICNKQLGLSCGKIQQFFAALWGLNVSVGGVCQAIQRTGGRVAGTWEPIRAAVRAGGQITPDETGWRVGGKRAWLHVAVGAGATLYRIARGRGVEAIKKLLGRKYGGVLVHDGWPSYDWFAWADHQQCLAHLLRRCRELRPTLTGAPRRWVGRVKGVLQAALDARDQRDAGTASAAQTQTAAEQLQRRLEKLVNRVPEEAETTRLAKHLGKHVGAWLVFLQRAGIDATNFRAEQALRPAVVNRKVWGGNRTWHGARTQAVLMSLLQTARQQGQAVLELLEQMLCTPDPQHRAALLWKSN